MFRFLGWVKRFATEATDVLRVVTVMLTTLLGAISVAFKIRAEFASA